MLQMSPHSVQTYSLRKTGGIQDFIKGFGCFKCSYTPVHTPTCNKHEPKRRAQHNIKMRVSYLQTPLSPNSIQRVSKAFSILVPGVIWALLLLLGLRSVFERQVKRQGAPKTRDISIRKFTRSISFSFQASRCHFHFGIRILASTNLDSTRNPF